ncbi:MAG: hypothetical protein WCR52_01700 [Bacteroidota bacterium]
MKPKLEDGILKGIALCVWIYIVLRARLIPITIDEVSTCINHLPRTYWEILTYAGDATPNNHILNTLLIKGLVWFLGMNHFVVRIPVLIGSLLYLWAGLNLTRRLPGFWFQLCAFVLLVANPYMLEFFALARGYGLGIGMMMMAILQAVIYIDTRKDAAVAKGLVFAFLAVAANFTLLNFFVPFVFFFSVIVFQYSGQRFWRVAWLLPAALVITGLFCYLPVTRMRATDQFQFWHANGFFKDTLFPLISSSTLRYDYIGGKTIDYLVGFAVLFAVGAWITAIVRLLRAKGRLETTGFISALFAGTVVVNLLNVLILNTPFLDSRTALFFYPLFALQLIVVAQWLQQRWGNRVYLYLAPICFFALFNTCVALNFSNTYEWWFDGGTFQVLDYFKETYEKEHPDKPYTLDSKWVMLNSLMFHIEHSTPHYEQYIKLAGWHGHREYPRDTEFFYTDSSEDVDALISAYDIVLRVPQCSLVLLRKKKDLQPNQ